jgi:hypothetical protein
MTTMTAGQQKEHPGVVAMRAHVAQLEDNLRYYERCAHPDAGEARLEAEIAEMQAKLDELRRVRLDRASRAEAKRAELEQARKTLAQCEVRPAVAQLMWCKLLMERSKKK